MFRPRYFYLISYLNLNSGKKKVKENEFEFVKNIIEKRLC